MMPPKVYEDLMEQVETARSLAMLDRSMQDIKAGRTHDAKQAVGEIAADLGLKLDR